MTALGSRLRTLNGDRGQALVEFSLAILVFVAMIVGIFDLGRGIYTYNGVSEAAREIARATSVHPGNPLGTHLRTTDTVAVQQGLVPGMAPPVFACIDYQGAAVAGTCSSGDFVQVTVSATYSPISFLGLGGPIALTSSSSMQLP